MRKPFFLFAGIASLVFSSAVVADTFEVRQATALPPATLAELSRVAVPPGFAIHDERERPPLRNRMSDPALRTTREAATAAIAAPPQTTGFTPIVDTYVADPSDAGGAVGPRHILSTSNTEVTVHDRTGKKLAGATIGQFWSGIGLFGGSIYDQRAVYDARADRWVIAALYDVNFTRGELLLAISTSGDPTAPFARYHMRVNATNDTISEDFTRLALSRDTIMITAGEYSGDTFLRAVLWTLKASDAYATPSSLPISRYGRNAYELIPIATPDTDGALFIDSSDLNYRTVERATGTTTTTIATLGINATPGFQGGVPNEPRFCPQAGTSLLMDCGELSTHNAVMRNGTLWFVESGAMVSPLRNSLRWWKSRPFTSSQPPVEIGLVDDPTGASSFGFASIAANNNGAALIGYSLFSTTAYPSAGYTYIDPLGRASAPALLKAGTSPFTFDRWADFSTTVVDPLNDRDFWTLQTYAIEQSAPGRRERWAMWWGNIAAPAGRGRAVHH